MAKRKSSIERLNAKKQPKKVQLDYDFAGMKAGSMMYVGTPQIIDAFIKKIPHGTTRTVNAMRNELARRHGCDNTCPVSTAIFIRISAEAALERLNDGADLAEVTPFWRLISSADKVTKKLDVDPQWVDELRALEASK